MFKNAIVCILCLITVASVAAEVQVITLDNKILNGKLTKFSNSPQARITLKTATGDKHINCLDIVEIFCHNPQQNKENQAIIVLNDGSKIYGKIINGNQQALTINSGSFGLLSIELTKISEVRLNKGLNKHVQIDPENDVLYFKNGDVMKCLIDSFGKGYVQIQHPQLGIRKEYFEKLERISFAQLETIKARSDKLSITLVGIDNSQLHTQIISCKNEMLHLQAPYLDTSLNIPLRNIRHFFFQGGRFVYISDLPTQRYSIEHIPYFPTPPGLFTAKLDRNQRGGNIALGGRTFFKGIGVISRTEIKVKLNKKYQKFQSHIGIDDEIKKLLKDKPYLLGGSVIFQVFVDGEKKYESKIITSSSPAQRIEIDIKNKNELMLIVDFADNAYVNDIANWAGARLVK